MIGRCLSRISGWIAIGLAVSTVLVVAPGANAQDGRSPKVIELEGIDVIGRVAKPMVFYILTRSTVRYEQLKLDQSFVKRIVETARKNPF